MTDPDLAALRAMAPRASAVLTGGVAASQLLAELDKHLEMVGALVGELVRRDAVIREAVGDPEYELDWSDLVERCRKLHRAVHDPGIVGLRYHRKRLREDIERSKGGMQAGLGRITVDRGLLSTILDVLDDIEAAR